MTTVNIERAATILVESIYSSDKEVAKRWAISKATITNYRKRTDKDAELALLFDEKRRLAELQWADQLGGAILDAIDFVKRASKEADPKDPEAIHAVTGSLKILAQIDITRTAINARYALSNGQTDSATLEVRASSSPANPKIIEPD